MSARPTSLQSKSLQQAVLQLTVLPFQYLPGKKTNEGRSKLLTVFFFNRNLFEGPL